MTAKGYVTFPVDRLIPRRIRPDEIRHVRQAWWNQAAEGYRLPAERGVIVINGGRR